MGTARNSGASSGDTIKFAPSIFNRTAGAGGNAYGAAIADFGGIDTISGPTTGADAYDKAIGGAGGDGATGSDGGAGGLSYGGTFYTEDNLSATNASFDGNQAQGGAGGAGGLGGTGGGGFEGGIDVTAFPSSNSTKILTVSATSITRDQAIGGAGRVGSDGGDGGTGGLARGGAIRFNSNGVFSFTNGSVVRDQAIGGAGGGSGIGGNGGDGGLAEGGGLALADSGTTMLSSVTVLDNDAIGGGGGVTYFGGIGGNDADGEGGGIFVDLDTILQAVGCSITGILRSAATPRKSIPKSMARSAPDECRPRIAPASHPISLSRATAGLAPRASGIDHSPS